MTTIVLGLEACASQCHDFLRGARFGLLMSRASVDHRLRLSWDVLAAAYPNQLRALFAPQHGWWGDAQANMIESQHGWHRKLGVPIYSLYCETRRPTPKMLDDIDCLVIDLQDVGTRVYTYLWTMLECLKACAEQGVRVLVLDRPNPIGGQLVEGPFLKKEFCSFVGGASIPMRHGLTMGELARLFVREQSIDVELNVVPIQGWSRDQAFDVLGRVWMLPSPNLPRLESTLVYPGQVLLEGTNLSEGRGTTIPFEVVGAPFVDLDALLDRLESLMLPGVRFLPLQFRPTFDKWQQQSCGGVSMHITDRQRFRPVRTSLAVLATVAELYPSEFCWLDPPYEYETSKRPIDIIYGGNELREQLLTKDAAATLSDIDVERWRTRTADTLLYESVERLRK